jgi:hypothetical protein
MTLVSERIEINIYWYQLKACIYINNFLSYLYKYRLSIYFAIYDFISLFYTDPIFLF